MADFKAALETLKKWRESNERKSRETFDIWINHLAGNIKQLGKDKHAILEQVILAALDCHKLGTAQKCIEELYNDFPNSLRVKKYEAMFLEAEGKYTEAVEILDQIIRQDESNSAAKKRKIAILKGQGRNVDAIKELVEYLKIFMADTEAWMELTDLYISEQDYNKAAFCVEELILHNPHNHLLHQRYADIKYTQGGAENIELAKAYYCQAIKLDPKNMRALYGLYLATTATGVSQKHLAQKKNNKDSTKLLEWVLAEIQKQYKEIQNDNIEERLNALQIN